MIYIKLTNDMRLLVTQVDPIYQGDNLNGAITFLIPQYIEGTDATSFMITLNYVRADGEPDTVILESEDTMYKDHYKYIIPVTCKLSRYPGDVRMWLRLFTGDSSHPTVNQSGECIVKVLESENLDDCMTNHQLTAIYQLKQQIDSKPSANVAQVQSDWNQNDETKPDFVKNRLAYTEGGFEPAEMVVDEIAVPCTVIEYEDAKLAVDYFFGQKVYNGDLFKDGVWYTVTIDGISYTAQGWTISDDQCAIGDLALLDSNSLGLNPLRKLPFLLCPVPPDPVEDSRWPGYLSVILESEETNHTISVQRLEGSPEVIHKLDPKYYEQLTQKTKKSYWLKQKLRQMIMEYVFVRQSSYWKMARSIRSQLTRTCTRQRQFL